MDEDGREAAYPIEGRVDHLARRRSRDPGHQPDLAAVLLATLPGRPQGAEDRVRIGALGEFDAIRRRRVGRAGISAEAPAAIVPRYRSRRSPPLTKSIRVASRSSSSLSLTIRRFAPSAFDADRAAQGRQLLRPEQRHAPRLDGQAQRAPGPARIARWRS